MGHRPSYPCHLFHHLQVGCHLDWMLGYPRQLSQKIAAQLPPPTKCRRSPLLLRTRSSGSSCWPRVGRSNFRANLMMGSCTRRMMAMIWSTRPRSKIDENNGALITHRRAPSENLAPILLASSPAVGSFYDTLRAWNQLAQNLCERRSLNILPDTVFSIIQK